MFSFLVITILLFKCLSAKHFKYIKSFDLFIRLLTNQSSELIDKCLPNFTKLNLLLKITIITFIVIWVKSLSILTKAFTGNLLNTYFNVKSVPIVNNLDDVYNNKELLVMAGLHELNDLNDSGKFDSSKIEQLTKRAVEFLDDYPKNFAHDKHFRIKNLIQGKLVLISNTVDIESFLGLYIKWKHLVSVSQEKYLPDLARFIIGKDHSFSSIMRYMYVLFLVFIIFIKYFLVNYLGVFKYSRAVLENINCLTNYVYSNSLQKESQRQISSSTRMTKIDQYIFLMRSLTAYLYCLLVLLLVLFV